MAVRRRDRAWGTKDGGRPGARRIYSLIAAPSILYDRRMRAHEGGGGIYVGASDDGAAGRVGSTDEGGGAGAPAPRRPAAVRPLACKTILPAPCQGRKECFGGARG